MRSLIGCVKAERSSDRSVFRRFSSTTSDKLSAIPPTIEETSETLNIFLVDQKIQNIWFYRNIENIENIRFDQNIQNILVDQKIQNIWFLSKYSKFYLFLKLIYLIKIKNDFALKLCKFH